MSERAGFIGRPPWPWCPAPRSARPSRATRSAAGCPPASSARMCSSRSYPMRGKACVSCPRIGRLEPGVGELAERGLDAEEPEEREDEPAARPEVRGRARDHPVEQAPAVAAPVVGGGHRVGPLAVGRRRHLGRAGADQVEREPAHRLEAVAEPDVDPVRHPVEHRVLPRAAHRRLHHVGGDHAGARARGAAPRPGRCRCRSRARARPGARWRWRQKRSEPALGGCAPSATLKVAPSYTKRSTPAVVGHLPITRRK